MVFTLGCRALDCCYSYRGVRARYERCAVDDRSLSLGDVGGGIPVGPSAGATTMSGARSRNFIRRLGRLVKLDRGRSTGGMTTRRGVTTGRTILARGGRETSASMVGRSAVRSGINRNSRLLSHLSRTGDALGGRDSGSTSGASRRTRRRRSRLMVARTDVTIVAKGRDDGAAKSRSSPIGRVR